MSSNENIQTICTATRCKTEDTSVLGLACVDVLPQWLEPESRATTVHTKKTTNYRNSSCANQRRLDACICLIEPNPLDTYDKADLKRSLHSNASLLSAEAHTLTAIARYSWLGSELPHTICWSSF